ncbi:ubiquinol-cytochrome C chaperone family protein [Sphingomonas sp. CFBP 8765]|uniref:ubiquinol-cytochrome C chaperone family protein n=1 Tax=Sphingomonas sp. CFBP 8765 TaxID=2775274 RepID=UPI00177CFDC6|nr:ubiquinol-cytochrome C chaperone family protein [Sphingomonas sp. CFBP 8765]MBD8469743.1 ubiquinol-cytochrome C chaperone [Sphingomonas sp. CFBP 8765]
MGWFGRLLGEKHDEALPLYTAVVQRARAEHWYRDGQVPDTVDGRFDMIAAVLALVMLRMESEPSGGEPAARLAERFVDDMDGQLRELGIGDIIVGKHIGRMMSMLGGRLGAYRDGLAAGDLDAPLVRNLYRGDPPAPAALAHVRTALTDFLAALAGVPLSTLLAGELP